MSEHIKENISPMILIKPLKIKTYGDIYYDTQTTEGAVKFFEDFGIFPKIRTCKRCQNLMRKSRDRSCNDEQKLLRHCGGGALRLRPKRIKELHKAKPQKTWGRLKQ
ncbi:16874_t:CDS:2, partial [Racocetra fulgida]